MITPGRERGELQMWAMAVRNRWLTEELKPLAIEAIRSGLQSSQSRVQLAATKLLLTMESQNQRDELASQKDADRSRFLAIAERLGLSSLLGITAEARTSGDSTTIDGRVVGTRDRSGEKAGQAIESGGGVHSTSRRRRPSKQVPS